MANAVVAGCTPLKQRSQKQRRAAFNKERRKRKRQALAKLRDSELPEEESGDVSDNGDEEEHRKAEEERQRLHLEWLQREEVAQAEFRLKVEREEAARKKREEDERRIKEEWEEQQRKEEEEKERRQQEKMDRETKGKRLAALSGPAATQGDDEAVQKMLDQAESQLEGSGPWRNPEAPLDYGTEKDRANCPFFLKTGACRFGDRCSRLHARPSSSTTLMIRSMFVTFSMEQIHRDDYDTDASLEYSEDDVHQNFLEFYEDVLPEFRSAGKVVQFKVSCNFEPHLRGNVYVQYETEEQCMEAFVKFNGRFYAGRQLQCEFSPVTRWKTAICGLFDRNKCPKGKHCNFLHVFRNPTREFWEADQDLTTSPNGALTRPYSDRISDRRAWSDRHRNYSPDRSGKRRWWGSSRGSWEGEGRGSRSREGRSYREGWRSQSKEGWSQREGRRSRSKDRRSRSKDRRSRSKDRRSRSKDRRSRSKDRRSRSKDRRSRSKDRRSRSKDRRSRSKDRRSRSKDRRSRSKDRRSRSKDRRSRSKDRRSRSKDRRSRSKDRRSRSKDRRSRSKDRRSRSKDRRSQRKRRRTLSRDRVSWSRRESERRSESRSPSRSTDGGSPSQQTAEGGKRRRSQTRSPKTEDSKHKKSRHKRSKKSSKKKKSKKKQREKNREASPAGSSGVSEGEGAFHQPVSTPGEESTETAENCVSPLEQSPLRHLPEKAQGGGALEQQQVTGCSNSSSPAASLSSAPSS